MWGRIFLVQIFHQHWGSCWGGLDFCVGAKHPCIDTIIAPENQVRLKADSTTVLCSYSFSQKSVHKTDDGKT